MFRSNRLFRCRCLFFALFLSLQCFLVGCAGSGGNQPARSDGAPEMTTASKLLAAIEASQTELPACRNILRMDAATESCRYLSIETAALLYAENKTAALPEYARMNQCLVRLADSMCGFEIHVMEGKTVQDAEGLEELCRNRLHLLQTRELHLYMQDAYERYVAAGQVIVRGRYVFLLLTADNQAAVAAIDKIL